MGRTMFSGNWQEVIKAGLGKEEGGRINRLEPSMNRSLERHPGPAKAQNQGMVRLYQPTQEPSMADRSREAVSGRRESASTQYYQSGMMPATPERQQATHDPGDSVEGSIQRLVQEARVERLECALPLIESMQISIAVDRVSSRSFPGNMTVNGWIGLLDRWESQLSQTKKRQIFFAKPFFQDAWQRSEADNSPLAPVLQELVEMMDRSLEIT